MPRTRSEAIADAIAARIVRNKSRKKFSALYSEALQEIYTMPTPTSSNGLNTSGSSAVKIQIGRDQNVEQLGQKPVADNASISTMGVNSQVGVPTAKPVDRKTITGSTPGDFRAKGAPAVLPNQPGPRDQMAGQQNSKFYNENGKSFKSTPTGLDSDAGN